MAQSDADKIVRQVSKQILDMLAEDAVAQLSTKKLQKAAADFLQAYQIFAVQLEKVKILAKKLNDLRQKAKKDHVGISDSDLNNLMKADIGYSNTKTEKTDIIIKYFRDFYNAVHIFHEALNEALGQKVLYKLSYFNPKTNQMVFFETEDPLLAITDIDVRSSGQLNARFAKSRKSLEDIIVKNPGKIRQSAISRANNDLPFVNKTYQYVKQRWNYGVSKKNHRVMWKLNNEWNVYKVSAQGDIDEAYGAIIFTRRGQQTNFRISNLQLAIEAFMEFVKMVDSTSGIFQGDYSEDGIEYAAKAGGASFMGFAQFVTIAKAFTKGELNSSALPKMKQEFEKIGQKKPHAVRIPVEKAIADIDYDIDESFQQMFNREHAEWNALYSNTI